MQRQQQRRHAHDGLDADLAVVGRKEPRRRVGLAVPQHADRRVLGDRHRCGRRRRRLRAGVDRGARAHLPVGGGRRAQTRAQQLSELLHLRVAGHGAPHHEAEKVVGVLGGRLLVAAVAGRKQPGGALVALGPVVHAPRRVEGVGARGIGHVANQQLDRVGHRASVVVVRLRDPLGLPAREVQVVEVRHHGGRLDKVAIVKVVVLVERVRVVGRRRHETARAQRAAPRVVVHIVHATEPARQSRLDAAETERDARVDGRRRLALVGEHLGQKEAHLGERLKLLAARVSRNVVGDIVPLRVPFELRNQRVNVVARQLIDASDQLDVRLKVVGRRRNRKSRRLERKTRARNERRLTTHRQVTIPLRCHSRHQIRNRNGCIRK